jgi:hypothetical protein
MNSDVCNVHRIPKLIQGIHSLGGVEVYVPQSVVQVTKHSHKKALYVVKALSVAPRCYHKKAALNSSSKPILPTSGHRCYVSLDSFYQYEEQSYVTKLD